MVDKDPIEHWTFGRVTLAGDAAHPMYPRGSNGAAQAAIDARTLADLLAAKPDPRDALKAYEAARAAPAAKVVRTNREHPPDFINIKVEELVGDKPFDDLDKYITPGRTARAVGELQAHRRFRARRRGAAAGLTDGTRAERRPRIRAVKPRDSIVRRFRGTYPRSPRFPLSTGFAAARPFNYTGQGLQWTRQS